MYDRSSLMRMMILIIIMIFLLLVVSAHFSKRTKYQSDSSIFKENFIWQKKDKAYSLLLHSVTFHDSSFSAFSSKWDSLMTFPVKEKDIRTIKNKFGGSLYKLQRCTNCHKAE